VRCGILWDRKVDALVEGFIVDGNINIFGKPADRAVDLGKGSTALKRHWKAAGHGEETLEHPADPYVFFQVLRSVAEFTCACLQYFCLLLGSELQKGVKHQRSLARSDAECWSSKRASMASRP